jgi:hypothetical protein
MPFPNPNKEEPSVISKLEITLAMSGGFLGIIPPYFFFTSYKNPKLS